jgi:hypothetical protein
MKVKPDGIQEPHYLCGTCGAPIDFRRVENANPAQREFFCNRTCERRAHATLGASRLRVFVESMNRIMGARPSSSVRINHKGHRAEEFPAEMHLALQAAALRRNVNGAFRIGPDERSIAPSGKNVGRGFHLIPFADFEAEHDRKSMEEARADGNKVEIARLTLKHAERTARRLTAHRKACEAELAEAVKKGDASGQEWARRQLHMIAEAIAPPTTQNPRPR